MARRSSARARSCELGSVSTSVAMNWSPLRTLVSSKSQAAAISKAALGHRAAIALASAVNSCTDSANTGYQRDLSVSHRKVAGLAAESGDPGAATVVWERALEFCTEVLGSDHPLTNATRDQLRESPDDKSS